MVERAGCGVAVPPEDGEDPEGLGAERLAVALPGQVEEGARRMHGRREQREDDRRHAHQHADAGKHAVHDGRRIMAFRFGDVFKSYFFHIF